MARTKHHGDRQKRKLFGEEWRWLRVTPGWWTRVMMTRPQRAETRQLIEKVKRLDDLEESPLFPLAKKPHQYYW
jgi:hypothetical protein